jgi:hypothetical protein
LGGGYDLFGFLFVSIIYSDKFPQWVPQVFPKRFPFAPQICPILFCHNSTSIYIKCKRDIKGYVLACVLVKEAYPAIANFSPPNMVNLGSFPRKKKPVVEFTAVYNFAQNPKKERKSPHPPPQK